ncbi:MAG TPA: hypothetical protein VF368_07045 [Gemmatimonadaceae bacterium]
MKRARLAPGAASPYRVSVEQGGVVRLARILVLIATARALASPAAANAKDKVERIGCGRR